MARPRITARPVVTASALLRPPPDPPPFPLAGPHAIVRSPARALRRAAQACGLAGGSVLVAPEALHPGVAAALGEAGIVLRRHPGLWPDEEALDALVDEPVAGLLLVHQLGWPADGARWRRWCDERGLVLLEDARDALFAWSAGGPAGAAGHAAVIGLRGTLGLPGAVVVAGDEPDAGDAPEALVRAAGLLADPSVQGSRMGHFTVLAELLGAGRALDGFADPPAGASPLVLPLAVADAPAALARLRAAGVEAVAPWGGAGPAAVGLPVHQGLREADLERVAAAALGADARPRLGVRLERLDGIAEARPLWEELAPRTGNLFATPEWAEAWRRHEAPDAPLRIFACRRDDGTAFALLPFAEGGRPGMRTLRFVGDGPADRLGPLCAPADRPAAARAVRAAMDEARADLLIADALPVEEGWPGLLDATPMRVESSPVLALAGLTWDAFLAARSRNFREQVRRRERKLAKQHDLRFRLADDPDRLDEDFETLFRLHDARWEGASDAFSGDRRALHRDFGRTALERGWLRLWLLELDGEPVAAWQGFRYAGADWFYQSGRDPSRDKQSVGFVLLAHTVRDAIEAGMGEYRLLRGNEEYKGRFATHDPGLATLGVARSAAGRAAVTASGVVRRLPTDARRRLQRLAG